MLSMLQIENQKQRNSMQWFVRCLLLLQLCTWCFVPSLFSCSAVDDDCEYFYIFFFFNFILLQMDIHSQFNSTRKHSFRFLFRYNFVSFFRCCCCCWLAAATLLHCYTHTHTHYCLSLFLYSLAISSIYFFFALSTCWIHELWSKLVYVTKNFSVYFVSGFNEISVEYSDFVRYFTLISEYRLLLLTSFLTQFSFAFVCMCCWREWIDYFSYTFSKYILN